MALKSYFKGKSGKIFWANIACMAIVLIAVPIVTLYLLDSFTHHGEKIEVPSIVGKSAYEAEQMLSERELVFVINDSAYDKHAAPGAILDQQPKAGVEVKAGRVVYTTINMNGEPTVKLPAFSSSLRETMAMLTTLGFRLTPNEVVYGQDKDLVIEVKQGTRRLHEGELITRDRPLTIVVGGGDSHVDTLYNDDYDDEMIDPDFDF